MDLPITANNNVSILIYLLQIKYFVLIFLQQHYKMKNTGSRNRNKIDILKKSLQDKIFIYEDSMKNDNLSKVSVNFFCTEVKT